MTNTELTEKIKQLKKERNAIILAHNYQPGEIQDLADITGDSLELSLKAIGLKEEVILFCSVNFMGETAKILSPEKTVLMPIKEAGCPMADMITAADVIALRAKHPDAAFVTYVNSSAEVKAECDVTCTSSNALKVVDSLKEDKIVFVPDGNLGSWVAHNLPNKEIFCYSGYCPIHNDITLEMINAAKALHPNAPVIVHPECKLEVSLVSDIVTSTSGMLAAAKERPENEFIVATEVGMLYRLEKENPDKKFYPLNPKPVCKDMKYTTLESMAEALEKNQYEVILSEDIIVRAKRAIERMIELS